MATNGLIGMNSSHHGREPEVKQQMLEMSLNGRGIRDMARVLHISPTTVIEELKKEHQLQHMNNPAIQHMDPGEIIIEIH
jgi:insertion element IS1 protein InsB